MRLGLLGVLLFSTFVVSGIEENDLQNRWVEGEILSVSTITDPQKTAYEDALFTAKIRLNDRNGNVAVVLFPAFEKRILSAEAILRVGDLIRFKAIPFSEAPFEISSRQRFDDMNDFESDELYAMRTEKIVSFSGDPVENYLALIQKPADDKKPVLQNNISKEDVVRTRRKSMEDDLKSLNAEIIRHGGWEKWNQELNAARIRYSELVQHGIQETENDNFYQISEDYYSKNFPLTFKVEEPVFCLEGAIIIRDFLAKYGIDTIFVMVPYPSESDFFHFFPDLKDGVLDLKRLQIQQAFLENDLEMIDISRQMFLHRKEYSAFFQDKDHHQASAFNELLAQEIGRRLSRYHFVGQYSRDKDFAVNFQKIGCLTERCVTAVSSEITASHPDFIDKNSPVMITGDSYATDPRDVRRSLRAWFAYENGFLPDMVAATRNSGHRKILDLGKIPETVLKQKKVCIVIVAPWCWRQRWPKAYFLGGKEFKGGKSLLKIDALSDLSQIKKYTVYNKVIDDNHPLAFDIIVRDDKIITTHQKEAVDVLLKISVPGTIMPQTQYMLCVKMSAGNRPNPQDLYISSNFGLHQEIVSLQGEKNVLYFKFKSLDRIPPRFIGTLTIRTKNYLGDIPNAGIESIELRQLP